MPELPEVEVIRRDLEKEIVGRRIKEVEIRPGTNAMKVVRRHCRRKEFQDLLEGVKVESVARLGKKILFDLDNEHVMVVDLGPAGQLLKTSASDELAPHTHVVLSFTIGGQMRFVDPLKEGEIFVTPKEGIDELEGFRGFTIDPLEQQVAWQQFSQLVEDRDIPMKQLLMDESFIVGLGDIYSDEILFTSGIRHDRSSKTLSSQDVRRLYRALVEILQDAVKARGTSWGDNGYRDLHGEPGQYQLELKVYERDGEACRRCRNTV
ncbi:MAG TPA: DNA-formamidopyrimidine glycosylase family protein, partial [Actinomycetota bacterium]|nr:DNA-formamidopyrimidine glycosylase family protein [Actinomycetota bacterium]